MLPPAHPLRLEAAIEWAYARLDLGHATDALALFEDTRRLAADSLGAAHPAALRAAEGLAAALVAAGRPAEAVARYDEVLAAKRARFGAVHPEVAFTLLRSGEAMAEAGRWAAARVRLAEAAAMGERVSGKRSVYRMLAVQGIAMLDLAAGRLDAAARGLEDAWAVAQAELRAGHRYVQGIRRDRARLAMARGDAKAALAELVSVAREEAAVLPPTHPRVALTLHRLAEAQLALGRARDAAETAREALVHLASVPRGHRVVGQVERLLGVAVAAQQVPPQRAVATASVQRAN